MDCLIAFSIFILIIVAYTEEWDGSSRLYRFQPTVYRTKTVLDCPSERILTPTIHESDIYEVKIDSPTKRVFIRLKPERKFGRCSWPLSGTISLSDIGEKTEAIIIGKMPFSTSAIILLMWIFIMYKSIVSTYESTFIKLASLAGSTLFIIAMLSISYYFEKCSLLGSIDAFLSKATGTRHVVEQ